MIAIDIVKAYLDANEFSGLVSGDNVCGCELSDIADGACMLDGLQFVFVDQPSEQADLRARAKRLHDIVERAAGACGIGEKHESLRD